MASRPGMTAGAVLLGYVGTQIETIRSLESGVGSLDEVAIHKTRVSTRRLRSVLQSYRRLLDREQTDPIRDELKWLAEVLGGVRDLHVLRQHLTEEAAEVLGPGGLPRDVEQGLAEREAAAARQLHAALDSVRYAELRRQLDRLVEQPPLRRRADRAARRVLPALAGRAADGVDEAARLADEDGLDAPVRDERLHEVRKAAKRARYAAELALPVGGQGAQLLVERMTQLQEVLGRHQDSVMSRRVLAELSQPPETAAASAYAVGVLAGHEQAEDVATLVAYRTALRETTRGRARRWTRSGAERKRGDKAGGGAASTP